MSGEVEMANRRRFGRTVSAKRAGGFVVKESARGLLEI